MSILSIFRSRCNLRDTTYWILSSGGWFSALIRWWYTLIQQHQPITITPNWRIYREIRRLSPWMRRNSHYSWAINTPRLAYRGRTRSRWLWHCPNFLQSKPIQWYPHRHRRTSGLWGLPKIWQKRTIPRLHSRQYIKTSTTAQPQSRRQSRTRRCKTSRSTFSPFLPPSSLFLLPQMNSKITISSSAPN